MVFTIVGLGRMGLSIARALVDAGHTIHGYDVSPAARDRAASYGVLTFDSLTEAGGVSDVVMTSLPTVAIARDVVVELAELMPAGSLLIETSTSAPAFASDGQRRLGARGVRFVDCPVSGKPPALTMLVGGEPGVLGDAESALAPLGDLVHLGRTGAGYVVKLLQQYVKYARFLVAAEALTFARAEGLDVAATVRALTEGTGGRAGLASAEEYFLEDSAAVALRAPASTIEKDMELTHEMFSQAGFDSPSFAALADFFRSASERGSSQRPYPEVIDLLPGFRFPKEHL